MKIKAICLGMMAVIMLVTVTVPSSNAGECEYGTVQAWARTLNDDGSWGEWQNATVHETLKTHELFQVKVKVTTKVECSVSLWLSGAGTVPAYEVTSGVSDIAEHIPPSHVQAGWHNTYEWTIRPTGNWTDGTAVLNVETQFHVIGDDKFIDFTIIAAYIENQEWQGNGGGGGGGDGNGSGGGGIPGFESMAMIAAFIVALGISYISKRRKK